MTARDAEVEADASLLEAMYSMSLSTGGGLAVRLSAGRERGRAMSARRGRTGIVYAERTPGGRYVTKYATARVSFGDNPTLPSYHCTQSPDGVLTVFQTLADGTEEAAIVFSEALPYMAAPTVLVEGDGRLTLGANLPVAGGDGAGVSYRDGWAEATGYLYVITVDVMTGGWEPAFEATRPLRYAVAGVAHAGDGRGGMLVATLPDPADAVRPRPRRLRDIPAYVADGGPGMASMVNVPRGVSVYDPSREAFAMVPLSGSADWGVASVSVTPPAGGVATVAVSQAVAEGG